MDKIDILLKEAIIISLIASLIIGVISKYRLIQWYESKRWRLPMFCKICFTFWTCFKLYLIGNYGFQIDIEWYFGFIVAAMSTPIVLKLTENY